MGDGVMQVFGIVLLIGLPVSILLLIFGDSTISRAGRLASFSRRQGVELTASSAAYVSNALARSRFWRRLGLVIAFVSGAGVRMPFGASHDADAPRAQWLVLFGGWFLGLIVAEWRAAGTAGDGPHRGALLTTRRVDDYVSRSALWWPASFSAIALGAGGWFAVRVMTGASGGAGNVRTALLSLTVAAVAAGLLFVTVRRIVRRPQAAGDNDLRRADDGLRSRSLQLLCGGATAASSFVAAALLAVLGRTFDFAMDGSADLANIGGLGVLVAFVGAVAGIFVGTTPTPRPAVGAHATAPVGGHAG